MKCPKCGSEKVQRSRVRSGERTAARIFLKPMRCSTCGERFWVHNRSAYVSAAAILGGVTLFLGLISVIVVLVLSSMDVIPPHKIAGALPSFVSDAVSSYSDVSNAALQPDTGVSDQRRVGADTAAQGRPADVAGADVTVGNVIRLDWYLEMAQKGDAGAQYWLGMLYLVGEGTLQDFGEAAIWLRRAADQGHPQAKYRLGLMYRAGHGVPTDLVQSYKWLNLAAAAGITQAVRARNEVLRSLSSEQLAQAQKASRAWQPQVATERREGQSEKAAANSMGPAVAMEGGAAGSAAESGQTGAKARSAGTSGE